MRPRALLVLALALLLAALLAAPARAQERIRLEGSVRNGTTGQLGPAGLEVTLWEWKPAFQRFTPIDRTRTGEGGRFSVEIVQPAGDSGYGVTVDYLGVAYQSPLLRLEELGGGEELTVQIYETTESLEGLRIAAVHLLLEPVQDRLQVTEITILENPGDRTAAPGEGEGVRFWLPPGASGVELADPAMAERAVTYADSIVDRTPVPPGQRQIVYSYRLDPRAGTAELRRRWDLPVAKVNAFLPEGTAVAQLSPGLRPLGPVEMANGARWERYGGEGIEPGQEIALAVPVNASLLGYGSSRLAGLGLGGLAVGTLILGAAWWRGLVALPGLGRREPLLPPAAVGLQALALLDRAYETGELEEAAYRERRGQLLREVSDALG